MSFDPSAFTAEQRRIMHRAGRADGDAERDAAWIAFLNSQRTGPGIIYVQDNTPDGSALTGANLAASITTSIAAAQAAGIEIVQIPAGNYYMNSSDEIMITAADRAHSITICGAGYEKTQLIYPTGYTGTAFFFKNSPPQATSFMVGGGMRDMTISVATEDASTTGTGVQIEGMINGTFDNVVIRNFSGGTGFKSTRGEPDYTNQYVQFYNVTCAGCYYNFNLTSLVNAQAYGLFSGSAQNRDFLIDDVKFSIYGGYMQSACAVGVEFPTGAQGGCRFCMYDIYFEGVNTGRVQFKFAQPANTFNTLEVRGFQQSDAIDKFLDVDFANNVVLSSIYKVNVCTTIVKSRNGANVRLEDAGNPISTPSKFDFDTASLSTFSCFENGIAYTGAKIASATVFSLPGFAEASEPISGLTGDIVYNTTSTRPRFKGTSSWKDLSYSDDPVDLTSIIAPYAVEIFDPGVYRTRSVISSNLDALTGLLNGTTIQAPASGQRPAWSANDDFFGSKPSFTCALTGNHYLSGTLAQTIPIGSHPGVFVVYRVPGGTNDPLNRRVAVTLEKGADHSSMFLIGQSDLNQSNKAYSFATGSNSGEFAVGATGTDAYGHVSYGYSGSFVQLSRDLETVATGLTPGATATVIDKVLIGAAWDTATYVGADITIAYVAILSSSMPADTITKALHAALAKYSLR